MQTSMRVTSGNRDALAQVAATELGGVSLDEALRILLFEHLSRVAVARLGADSDYRVEAVGIAQVDVRVVG